MTESGPPIEKSRLRELAGLFLRLGFTAFGGPAAHVALMETEIVTRRQWLDRQHFLDLMAAVNFIPGPNSTELAIHVGQLRAGTRGLIVAGACFICPAMLIILPIAWAYVKWGTRPQAGPALHAIAAAITAVVVFATIRFSRTAFKDPFTIALGVLAAVYNVASKRYALTEPELLPLAIAAIAGSIWYRARQPRTVTVVSIALPMGFWPELLRLAAVMLKIGATLFGSGYVLISYLQSEMVDHRGWLSQQQLLDAIAVGQFTPGPLLTTATFVGYLLGSTKFGGGMPGGIIAGVAATIAIFLPAFVLVAIFGPILNRIRHNIWARGALDGMNAAVVGLMAIVAFQLLISATWVPTARHIDVLGVFIFVASMVALWKKVNATWLVLAAALIGAIAHFVIA
ncbi:MAG TPA: chromate efflux transporter [Tepidisphaeraceae bacterium]|jgi:chromate transporter